MSACGALRDMSASGAPRAVPTDIGLQLAARAARARARLCNTMATALEGVGRRLLRVSRARRVRWVGLMFGPRAPVREVRQVEVAQQHGAGQQRGGRVSDAAAGDVLGYVPRALLEHGALVAHVHARQDARPACKARHLRGAGSAQRPRSEW